MRRILVTGSRNWQDYEIVRGAIAGAAGSLPATVVHGAAKGADACAARAARELGLAVDAHPADWARHGRRAGPIRNTVMVALGADVCLAFPGPDSIGTWDCIRKAVSAHIPVRIYPPAASGAIEQAVTVEHGAALLPGEVPVIDRRRT